MVRLIAKSRVYYPSGGGMEYKPGDTFETVTERDAEALVLVGLAEYPKKPPPPKKTLTLKTPAAIETTQAAPSETKDLTAGYYGRRDMRAIEE